MKVLMISIDKGLLGRGQMGDVVERHIKYGQNIDQLDIVVFSSLGFETYSLSDNVKAYPTNSKMRIKYYFDAIRISQKLFNQTRYDLIVTQEPFLTGLVGLRLKKRFGSKLLVHFHGDFWSNPSWLRESKINYLFLILSRYVVKRADKIRVVSSGIKKKLTSFGVPDDKVFVLPTLVDIEKYNFSEDIKKDENLILHVGRYDEVKNLSLLAKAFVRVKAKIPNAKLLQIGGGIAAKRELQDIEVSIKPMTDHNELVKYFHQASVLVLSSTSESLGKVLIEANASGTPVVSTSTTGAREIIEDGINGYLVPVGDAEKLAEKIIYLLENPQQASDMGQRGKELVKEKFFFTAKDVTTLWERVLKS